MALLGLTEASHQTWDNPVTGKTAHEVGLVLGLTDTQPDPIAAESTARGRSRRWGWGWGWGWDLTAAAIDPCMIRGGVGVRGSQRQTLPSRASCVRQTLRTPFPQSRRPRLLLWGKVRESPQSGTPRSGVRRPVVQDRGS